MRTDGIQATTFEPEPDNAPSGSSTDGYNITHGGVSNFLVRVVRPPNVEQLSPRGKGYLAHYHDRVAEAIENWDLAHKQSANAALRIQCSKAKAFLQFIENCLLEYLLMGKEEGTIHMLDRVEELLERAEARLEPQRLAR